MGSDYGIAAGREEASPAVLGARRIESTRVTLAKGESSRMVTANAPGTRIYMDANATTPLLPEVVDAMRPYWTEHFGNASSIHMDGQFARAAVDHARESVARLLRCRASEVVFTSGGTE